MLHRNCLLSNLNGCYGYLIVFLAFTENVHQWFFILTQKVISGIHPLLIIPYRTIQHLQEQLLETQSQMVTMAAHSIAAILFALDQSCKPAGSGQQDDICITRTTGSVS